MNEERLDVEKLEAGRELDILIAERVMGFQLESDGTYRHPNTPFHAYPFVPKHEAKDLPAYSTDPLAALTIVDRIGADVLIMHYRDRAQLPWLCGFGKDQIAEAQTLPLAICQAALLTTTNPVQSAQPPTTEAG